MCERLSGSEWSNGGAAQPAGQKGNCILSPKSSPPPFTAAMMTFINFKKLTLNVLFQPFSPEQPLQN